MFIENHQPHEWLVTTGVIDHMVNEEKKDKNIGIEKLMAHEYVLDTIDGALTKCLSEIDGRKVKLYAQGSDDVPLTLSSGGREERVASPEASAKMNLGQDNRFLHASCHCAGVRFHVSPPSGDSEKLSSPWPDLLVSYHSSSPENIQDVKWWLRANKTKFLAGTCACRSCRIASGFPIQAWAFIPRLNIHQHDGSALNFQTGTLSSFESSTGVFRHFCKVCGATAFWRCNLRPDLIDVSVGLLRAKEGSRASSWLEWHTDRVSFKEEAFDRTLIDALEGGLKGLAL